MSCDISTPCWIVQNVTRYIIQPLYKIESRQPTRLEVNFILGAIFAVYFTAALIGSITVLLVSDIIGRLVHVIH